MALAGGILGGGIGGAIQAGVSKALQEDAQRFQTSFYKQRYQRQMKDMRLAGLNPILAYKTGVPGSATSAGIASTSGIAGAFAAGLTKPSEVRQKSSAADLLDEQTQTQKAMTRTQIQLGQKTAQEWQNAVYTGKILEGQVPAAEATGAFDATPMGQRLIKMNRGIGLTGQSANQIMNLFKKGGAAARPYPTRVSP